MKRRTRTRTRRRPATTGALTRKQARTVAKIAKRTIMKTTEAKHSNFAGENKQLFHNIPYYTSNLLQTSLGLEDEDTPGKSMRVGDEIYLNNINARIWMSNKHDRPNVMYRIMLVEYTQGHTVDNALVFFTQTNKMLDRVNNEKVRVLAAKYVKPGADYTLNAHEHSFLITMNKKYAKPRKVVYHNGGQVPKKTNVALVVCCYDAFGTAQTDNIASFAYDLKLTWRDP